MGFVAAFPVVSSGTTAGLATVTVSFLVAAFPVAHEGTAAGAGPASGPDVPSSVTMSFLAPFPVAFTFFTGFETATGSSDGRSSLPLPLFLPLGGIFIDGRYFYLLINARNAVK
jgi:hypothetical protein